MRGFAVTPEDRRYLQAAVEIENFNAIAAA
jgi:hypothetical protein